MAKRTQTQKPNQTVKIGVDFSSLSSTVLFKWVKINNVEWEISKVNRSVMPTYHTERFNNCADSRRCEIIIRSHHQAPSLTLYVMYYDVRRGRMSYFFTCPHEINSKLFSHKTNILRKLCKRLWIFIDSRGKDSQMNCSHSLIHQNYIQCDIVATLKSEKFCCSTGSFDAPSKDWSKSKRKHMQNR